MDLVFEGRRPGATARTRRRSRRSPRSIARAAGPWQVEGDAFTAPYSAPSAGPPPWHLFRVTVHTVFGIAGAEPHGATRWRF